MKNKEVDKHSEDKLDKKDDIEEIKVKKKVKPKEEKKGKEKKKREKKSKEKKQKEKHVKEKKPNNRKNYGVFLSVLIIIISFVFIVLGILVGLIGTGIINIQKDEGPTYYSLSEKLKIGNYVKYDAGVWEEDKDVPNRNNAYTLGGYSKDSSRNDGVTCNYISDLDDIEQKRSGWRVFSIEEDIVTLIHDGISMCYYHGYGNNTNDKSVNILSGNDENVNFDYYLDDEFANGVKILSKEDIDKFYGEDSSYKKINKDLISVGIPYWLATKQGTNFMWYVTKGGMVATDQVGLYGVRVLVTLKKEVKTIGLTENKEWILAIEEEKKDE